MTTMSQPLPKPPVATAPVPVTAAPGRVDNLPGCVITCAAYDRSGRRTDISLDAISDVLSRDDGSFVWVGLYEPEDEVLCKLQEEFGLHDLAVEDARNAHQRPKIETYGNALFLALHTVQLVGEKVKYGETQAFLGPHYLVTVRHGASLSYTPARQRIEREPELMANGPAYCLYTVLDYIVDNYQPVIQGARTSLEGLEHDIFSDTYRRDVVRRLYDLKRELTVMRVAVAPLQDVLAQMVRSQNPMIPDEVRLYLRDVQDHLQRVNDGIDSLRDMLGTALSVNLAMVTLGQGEIVKRLGAWAALLAAPTLVASWYGMNFEHMPELHQPHAYAVLIATVATVCVLLYRQFRKSGWM